MRALAEAVIAAAAFLELSDEDAFDLQEAAAGLEAIAFELGRCTPKERAALKDVLARRIAEERAGEGRENVLQFYENFLHDAGLDDQRARPNPPKNRPKVPAKPVSHEKQLWEALELGETAKLAALLRKHPVLIHSVGKRGITPLHWAAQGGNLEMVTLFLDGGVNINAIDEDGNNALHWSALGNSPGHQSVAKLLIARGANTKAKNRIGETPRQKANTYGKNAVLLH